MHDAALDHSPSADALAEAWPLGPMQAGMLYTALLDEGSSESAGYDIEQIVIRFEKQLSAAALKDAWRELASRHAALRLSFSWRGLDRPLQRVQANATIPVVEHDWSGVDEAEVDARVQRLLADDRRRGFDMSQAPLARAYLCRCKSHDVLLWSFHHIILDGMSFAPLLYELVAAHDAYATGNETSLRLPPPPRPFTDYLDWSAQARRDHEAARAYFRELLRGKSAPTPLPAAEPASNPLPTRGSHEIARPLSAETTAALRALATESKTGLGTVVTALWTVFLARWTGENDILFGNARSCRRTAFDGRGADDVVGIFINTVPLRARVEDGASLGSLLQELRAQTAVMRDHDHTSLVDAQGVSEIPRGVPLFETLLMYNPQELNRTLRALDPSWSRRHADLVEQPLPPLVLKAFDAGDAIDLRLLYDRRRYRPEVIERMLRHLGALAQRMTRGTEQKLGELDAMPDDEREQILFGWNDTARGFPDDLRIHELFEQRVALQPDAIALEQGAVRLTYRDVEERANRLAHLLRQRGATPGNYVGLCLDRTPEMVIALLGIAKSGAAYVPVDADYPSDRIAFMLEDAKVELVVTERALADRIPASVSPIVIDDHDRGADGDHAAIHAMPSTRPAHVGAASDVCYAIFTSGSTGRPKGVVLTHKAVVNTFDWVSRTFEVRPGDKLLFVTSVCFDLSVYDTFGALGAGATVVVASAADLRDPAALVKHLTDGVTIWDSAPQALQRLAPYFPKPRSSESTRSKLRLVMLSGDWIPLALPPAVHASFPKVTCRSLGGATEAAIWSNWYPIGELDPRWPSVPYGWPIQNARYHILDGRLRPIPPGVAGDLYIGGTCLASGYLNRVELTAERFIRDPFRGGDERLYKTGDLARYFDNGVMEFLGRADFQVKVRGFRVELGEIESALLAQSGVREAACVARKDASGEKNVWGYVVGDALDAQALRRALQARLPDFMIPAGIIVLDKMPVSSNGKLDRNALPDPATAGQARAVTPARNKLEHDLVAIWEELLQRKPIGIDDSFFELGGHSLMATLLASRIKKQLDIDVPLARILTKPTIAALAESIAPTNGASAPEGNLVALKPNGAGPTVIFIAGIGGQVFTYREVAHLLGPDQPVHAFKAIGVDDGQAPRQSIPEIADEYERELLLPHNKALLSKPIVLGGFSLGALASFELGARLRRRGHNVALIVAFDAFAPAYPERLPMPERVVEHAKEFVRRDLAGRRAYLAERFDKVKERVLFKAGLGHLLAPKVDGIGVAEDETMRRVWAALVLARDGYRPATVEPTPLLLFQAAIPFKWPATRMDDPAYGWRRYVTGPIDVVGVKGAHLNLFETPGNAQLMATELVARLKKLGP